MANPEHLAILKQGVEVWNRWREESPEVRPNLRSFDLSEMELSGANLSQVTLFKANLRDANLQETNLSGADLARADLATADLTRANLRGARLASADLGWTNLLMANLFDADLSGANLSNTYLANANLQSAFLVNAHLVGADLVGANFTDSQIGITSFSDVNLRHVEGLETVKHSAPSSIGIDTIYRSGGKIPESFLRGAGVPEEFIVYMRSLVNNPIEYYSCFISYSSQDEEFARRLHTDLQAANVRCWFAPHDMKTGDKIRERIDESIRVYDKLLLILSCDSIFSNWVEKEVETAFEQEQPNRKNRTVLFPIRLDDEVMDTNKAWAADIRRTRHIGDFTRWKDHDAYKAALARLLRDLKASAKA